MRRRRRPEVLRRKGDGYVLDLPDDTREVLRTLGRQIDPLLDDPSAEPNLRRLFPPAHTDDVLAEAAWQIEQGARLRDSRRSALAALDLPTGVVLTEDEVVAWLQGVNSLRLVLSARLDVTADEDAEVAAIEHAAALAASADEATAAAGQVVLATWAVYQELGWLVDTAAHALSGD